ncbi:unnamed protein product [Rotaria magnacalcarata]|uniref:Guanylate-binding protein N-terminal domain-containing protein n=1 Tax=Rotaria magnacalcarata TaxID=392030 RepID=A0A815ZEI3_9BILA|nr:unnamed protein product [Rotaria magnacalcarata]CAF1583031.1 unnamed protein product [Rotaria magnacalcarata]CAF2253748.1 unnamed protein product [Rotaria magnacalcarata]CAF3947730.1 unnamed protein product [Rotaria magnacalcarata]CAF4098181.1 unnamed protein product [Rotaria magnacalcarata]
MASSSAQADYLLQMLKSGQVKNIDSSIFIDSNPSQTALPSTIDSRAINLLNNISGRIYPIALRGKCQAGKSTTLNRLAKISNFPLTKPLEVAESFGGSTTEGIWLMIITFTNEDALLLFDVQGTDRGADEVTHKLIAFTDHICTKVVDVFRMPLEGFSNDYINALYCLAMARDSIKNLKAASDKSILWTNCVLPKRSPLNSTIFCNTPDEYQTELLKSSIGERALQGTKAKSYAEGTSIITTSKPSDEILFKISELENDHVFVQNEVIPIVNSILKNVQPVKIAAHVINDGRSFVQYLNNVYSNIRSSVIDLPFCALPMIRSIAMSALKEKKQFVTYQMDQEVSRNSNDMHRISNTLIPALRNIKNNCIVQFQQELSDLPREQWEDQLKDLDEFSNNKIRTIVDILKPNVLLHFLEQTYPKLNQLCGLGSKIDKLRTDLRTETTRILGQMQQISFLQGNTNSVDREYVERALQHHQVQLCYVQEVVEYDWQRRIKDFEKYIYSDDDEGVGAVIDKMIREHEGFSQQKFSTFGITWKPFINIDTTRSELKQLNIKLSQKTSLDRKNQCISEFNKQIGMLMASNRTVPEKYGKLKMELEICLRQYYDNLPWPLNDQTIGAVDDELQRIFYRVMQNLFTPAVKEQLKRDRMAQMEMMSKLNLDKNESLLWVYCVGCRRIFAGRTRGCVNVTCCQFKNKAGVKIVDHGCGFTFEWAKAQPVPINTLSSEIWFSSIETDQRTNSIKNLISDVKDNVRNISSAGANGSGWSFPMK